MIINIIEFIIGLCIGFILNSLITKDYKEEILYPTLYNYANTTYIDDNNVCYKYYPKYLG